MLIFPGLLKQDAAVGAQFIARLQKFESPDESGSYAKKHVL
jgi:hypothetical protein